MQPYVTIGQMIDSITLLLLLLYDMKQIATHYSYIVNSLLTLKIGPMPILIGLLADYLS
jgi:hypothetical protein